MPLLEKYQSSGAFALSAPPRGGSIALAAAWILAALVALVQMLLPVEKHIVEFGIGDAMVYSRVAFNIARGLGSTYSLETPTNGYHPLWLIMHVPLFWGAADIVSRLWLAKLLWSLTALANALAWSLFVRRLTRSDFAAALAALLFSGFGWSLFVLYSGIETPLALLLICATFAAAVRLGECEGPPSLGMLCAYSLAGTLAFLSRLDSVFILFCTLPLGWSGLRQAPWPRLILSGAPVLLLVPYFAWNFQVMQTLMPVSGIVKTSTQPPLANAAHLLHAWTVRMDRIGIPGPAVALAAVVGLLPALWILLSILRRVPSFGRVLLAVLVGALAQYAYYLFHMTELNVPWHMYPQFLFIYLLLCGLVAWASALRPRLGRAAFIFLILLCGAATGLYARAKQVRQIETATALELGHWAAANLPPQSIMLMQDSFTVGALAPDLHLVDMSGLVEDLAGARVVKRDGPLGLLRVHPVTHTVIHTRDVTTPAADLHTLHPPFAEGALQPRLLQTYAYDRGSRGRFLLFAVNPLAPEPPR